MTAHNILKYCEYPRNEQGAIKWLILHGVDVKQKTTNVLSLYDLIHAVVADLPHYSGPDEEYELMQELLTKTIGDGWRELRHDSDYVYYADEWEEYDNELPGGSIEQFVIPVSYKVLIKK
jgi:hypothetical protein